MASHATVSLNDHFIDFADRQVASGQYASTREVVHAGLQLLEEREAKLAALRAALIEGEESGPPEPWDLKAFLEEAHARYAAEQ